jgi:hypothetical protein
MNLFRIHRREADLDDELRAFVDLLTSEKIRAGMNPADARRAALIESGGIEQIKEDCRDVRRFQWFESFRKDLHYALRVLRRSPIFTGVAVLILSLGIGATTAAFSLLDAIVLKPLPVESPRELVWFADPAFSFPIFREVQTRGKELFSGLFAWNIDTLSIEWKQEVQRAPILFVTSDFYSVLGLRPAAGRLLGPEDDRATNAVISYEAWRRRYDRNSAVIGMTVRLDRVPFTIVGVAPKGFFGVAPGLAPEITIPVATLSILKADSFRIANPNQSLLHIMARLRPGLSREQADAAVQVFWPQMLESVTSQSLSRERRAHFLSRRTSLMPGANGFSRVRNQFAEPLLLLLGLAGLLLLAACATIANLLLVRASARAREMAVRVAIGATRSRVIRACFSRLREPPVRS